MSHHPTDFAGPIPDALRDAVLAKLPGASVEVSGGDGHYSLRVVSSAFAGKGTLECHRLVYAAIEPLMRGDRAPVHAIDQLVTRGA